ncbi:uncharacterized protein LOC117225154 [Megalopta genalis]|uniref:uncharacterized protein LOC117225154 n=1 Tax=Megalopta genalis TaxID=115081 RepID=UPI003FD5AD68
MTSRFLSVAILCAFFLDACPAKPAEVLADGSSQLNPLEQQLINAVETDAKRAQRSPQFGFPDGGFGSYPDYDGDGPFDDGIRRHRHKHRPEGCGEFGCGGEGFGPLPGYYPSAGGSSQATAQASAGSNGGPFGGGSEASASAGSSGSGGPFGGEGGSQANAQSASFNVGPFSASFSIAESSSGAQQSQIY